MSVSRKQVGDPDHLKIFATTDAAETWFEENDPEGVAFEPEEVPDKSQNDHAGEDARHPNEEGSHLTFAPLFAS